MQVRECKIYKKHNFNDLKCDFPPSCTFLFCLLESMKIRPMICIQEY